MEGVEGRGSASHNTNLTFFITISTEISQSWDISLIWDVGKVVVVERDEPGSTLSITGIMFKSLSVKTKIE